jgi:cation diffusion facilitator family transporter
VNFLVSHYEYKQGRKLKSELLVADSYHTKSDIYASFAVIASLVAIKLGFPFIDLIAALFIVFLIARVTFRIIREGVDILADSSRIDPKEVKGVVNSIPGVYSCHRVRTRGTVDCIQMDLHLELEKTLSLEQVHLLSHQVERVLKERFPGLKDVVIHPEPVSNGHLDE